MASPFRIAVLGLHHDHVWSHLNDIHSTRGVKLVGAADPNLPLLNRVRQQFSCPTYADYNDLLEEVPADAVYLFANNRISAELAVTAANRGLHVLIEKPMAADLTGAEMALETARKAGVRMMVNWPFAWHPLLREGLRQACDGEIGRVWQVKYRAAHAGPRNAGCSDYFCDWLEEDRLNGAGALTDYLGYGAVLAHVLMGMPQTVQAIAGRYFNTRPIANDNAIALLTYPDGMAITEASWTQIGNVTSYWASIYGETATLHLEMGPNGRSLKATKEHPDGVAMEAPCSAPEDQHATAHFYHAVTTGEPFFPVVDATIACQVQATIEAALISSQSGMVVKP